MRALGPACVHCGSDANQYFERAVRVGLRGRPEPDRPSTASEKDHPTCWMVLTGGTQLGNNTRKQSRSGIASF